MNDGTKISFQRPDFILTQAAFFNEMYNLQNRIC